ncbi:MAG: hypothetical protein NC911_07850, partial [Candidatus Omnitrophica bacterium]|nr:hypothetical protein [Candidatus Omnitrophota bacterium]
MNELLLAVIAVCFSGGLICLLLPEKARGTCWAVSTIISLVLFGLFCQLFSAKTVFTSTLFLWDGLASLAALGVTFFGLVISWASLAMIPERYNQYYGYLLWTTGAGIGAVVANHLLLLAVFWGILAITLYLMINLAGPQAAYPAKKTFIIVGGSDSFLLLGLSLLYVLSGRALFLSGIHLPIDSRLAAGAFFSLTVAALAKAGAMPVHTWIPEISEKTWVPVMAFLPASLDKLLGIYLLARICLDLFSYQEMFWFVLRLIGAVTIVAAVFMALIQHNMKKLLAYHAVSQVGYMVLGLASANPVGILGGLFHMLNNAIY